MASIPNSIYAFGRPLPPASSEPETTFPMHVAVHQYKDAVSLFERARSQRQYSQAWEQASNILQAKLVTPATAAVEPSDSDEMLWLAAHVVDLEQFAGEWLLILGNELIGHARNFGDLRRLIAERQIQSPFLYYVPTREESNSISI